VEPGGDVDDFVEAQERRNDGDQGDERKLQPVSNEP
jgi:hypothetical protein